MSNNASQMPCQTIGATPVTNQWMTLPLLDCLSDRVPRRQMMKMVSMKKELTLTSTRCHGTNQKSQGMIHH